MSDQAFKQTIIVILLAVTLLAAGCQSADVAPASTVETDTTATAIPTAASHNIVTEPVPSSTPNTDKLALCPREEAGKSLYVSEIHGFCFLYPAEFQFQTNELRPNEVIKLVGPTEQPKPKQMEVATVLFWIANNGTADVADSAAYANKWREVMLEPMEAAELVEETAVIGGQPAIVLKNLPGMISRRSGYVVANGHKYTLTLLPDLNFARELEQPAALAWDTITSSIVFFPPILTRETIRAENVCPQALEGTRTYASEREGYCFLYPQDFEPIPDITGRIEGGPNLGNWQGFENIRTALTVGSYPQLAENVYDNPRDMLTQRSHINSDEVQDRTIGGARAVVFRDSPPGGPWASRQAIIVVDGRTYTVLSDPWEPERWPEAMPYLDNVWETAIGSMTFFTPWN
jgi:hypothetical protein